MKIIFKSLAILLTLCFFTACVDDNMIPAKPDFILSFERDGQATAFAGNTFYVINKGTGEFQTLFEGTKGKEYTADSIRKGIDFNKADSLPVTYKAAGTYNLSVVSTSTSNNGEKVTRNVKTVTVTVLDVRNNIVEFKLPIGAEGASVKGVFSNDSILFSLPNSTTNFDFAAYFKLGSDSATVYVGDVKQKSTETSNNFSSPITYTVKSPNDIKNGLAGKNYVVNIKLFAASTAKEITKFNFSSSTAQGEVGIIDEANKTITITANYATDVTSLTKLEVTSPFASTVYLIKNGSTVFLPIQSDARSKYNLDTNNIVRVKAQDGSQVDYTVVINSDKAVNSFTFTGLVPAPVGTIDYAASPKTITFNVLANTDVTKLIAKWVGSTGTVKVGSVVQKNGETANDFSAPVTYTFYKGSTAGESYNVIVNRIN